MRYTQNGLMEDYEPRHDRGPSWLRAFVETILLFVTTFVTMLIIAGGVYALRAVLDAMTRIFP